MSTWDSGGTFDTGGTFDDSGVATSPYPVAPVTTIPQPNVAADTLALWEATQPANEATGVTDEQLGWPWLTWLDGVGQIMQRVDDLCRDDTAGNPGWSILVDPVRCPTYALPWQAQLVGVRFQANETTDAAQRAAIASKRGFARGTVATILAVIAPYLLPGSSAAVYERSPDPYSFTVTIVATDVGAAFYSTLAAEYPTYTAWEVADPTYGSGQFPLAAIQAALNAAKPGGLIGTVTVAGSATYAQLSSAFPTYSAFTAALPTYTLVGTYQP